MPEHVHVLFHGPDGSLHAGGLGKVTVPAWTPGRVWNMDRLILLSSPKIEQICDFKGGVKTMVSRTSGKELLLDIEATDGTRWTYRVIPAVDTSETWLYFLGLLSEGEPMEPAAEEG